MKSGLTATVKGRVRVLAVVLGDQLDLRATPLREFDPRKDAVLMMEVSEEATHVPSHKQRTVLFLSAMRHFALELAARGFRVRYVKIEARGNTQNFTGEIKRAVRALRPQRLVLTHPGEWRVREMIRKWERGLGLPVELYPDEHFTQSLEEFSSWAQGRKQLVMEHFYRERRKKLAVLLESNGKPVGGQWNYDQENRQSFKEAPRPPRRYVARPGDTTKEVIRVVEKHFPDAPGRINSFGWPVTRSQAKKALANFVAKRLEHFGRYQDAMWVGEPWLYHSTLSSCLNLKLLSVEECIEAALGALERGKAPLNSVEGFIRQLIGWREFIRGVYWHEGSGYGHRNTFEQYGSLPEFYWTGETDMVCMRESLGQVIEHGYGHHIQRLIVTGNFALISGIHPRAIADWFLGMYVDAVDWVTTPNTVGMVMHADGGVVGTKPYAASGRYIQRMSNYCSSCRYDPTKRTGEGAVGGEGAPCPFTTFYWDFLIRNRVGLRVNRRMAMVLKNVDRMRGAEVVEIEGRAKRLREEFGIGPLQPRAPKRRVKA